MSNFFWQNFRFSGQLINAIINLADCLTGDDVRGTFIGCGQQTLNQLTELSEFYSCCAIGDFALKNWVNVKNKIQAVGRKGSVTTFKNMDI